MERLAQVISANPASLTNYTRMKEPCAQQPLQVHQDKPLSRVAFFQHVQVMHLLITQLGGPVCCVLH